MFDSHKRTPVLETDSQARKETPIFSGVLNYFPLAIAAIARHSKKGNDKHNPGQSLRWTRDKSTDHEDCIARHLIDIDTTTETGEYEEAVALAWRALAALQEREEKRLGKPFSRASTLSYESPDEGCLEAVDEPKPFVEPKPKKRGSR